MFYMVLTFGELLLLCFVLFFVKNKYRRDLLSGIAAAIFGCIINFVFHTVIGYIFVAIGIFVIILGMIAKFE